MLALSAGGNDSGADNVATTPLIGVGTGDVELVSILRISLGPRNQVEIFADADDLRRTVESRSQSLPL